MSIRVVLADDQEMVRTGFAMILGSCADIEVVGQCGDGVAALDLIDRLSPDVALLDIRMPRLAGIAVTRRVSGQTSVVIVTTFGDDEYVDQALAAGACGFLLKDSGPGALGRWRAGRRHRGCPDQSRVDHPVASTYSWTDTGGHPRGSLTPRDRGRPPGRPRTHQQ